MASYFIDPINGVDATGNGSLATPWKTINKAIGSSPAITMSGSGDTLFLIPTGPFREQNVTLGLTPGVGNVLTIQGDWNGAGQRAAGSTSPVTGTPIWSAYTTDDTTWPAGTNPVFNVNGKSYVTMQDVVMVGGRNAAACITTANTSTNLTFKRCSFSALLGSTPTCINYPIAASATDIVTLTVDQCVFLGYRGITLTPSQGTTQYNFGATITNSLFLSTTSAGLYVTPSGTSTYNGYGALVQNCTFLGMGITVSFTSGSSDSGHPQVTAYNNVFFTNGNTPLTSNTTYAYITEDYNVFYGANSGTYITSGGHSVGTGATNAYAPTVGLGLAHIWGLIGRPILAPLAGSPLLGFGAGGTALTTDFLGRDRPAGGSSATAAVGYAERQDSGTRSTTYHQAGSNSVKIAGPGSHEFRVAVTTSATTISIYALYDSSYGGGTLPTLELLAEPELNVAAQSPVALTDPGVATWGQISLAAFTPSAAGVVTIRVHSHAAATGAAYFDTAGVPAMDTSGMEYARFGEPLQVLVAQSAATGGGRRKIGVLS